jgi:hypothetical protein
MTYTYEAHSPQKRKNIPWPICKYCGLVYLNNDFTRWAVKMGCNNNDHPGYAAARLKFTRVS